MHLSRVITFGHFLVLSSISVSVIRCDDEAKMMALTAFENLKNLINTNTDPKGQPVTILRLQSSNINGVKDLAVRNATTEVAMEVRVGLESIRNFENDLRKKGNDLRETKCESEKAELAVNKIRNEVLKKAGFCSDKYFRQIEEKIQDSIKKINDFGYMIESIDADLKRCDSDSCLRKVTTKIEGHSAEYNMELNTIFDRMQTFTMTNSLQVAKCFRVAIGEGREKAKEITGKIKSCLDKPSPDL